MVVGLDAFRLQLNGFGNALRVIVRLSLNSRHVLCQGRLGAGSILHFFFSFFLLLFFGLSFSFFFFGNYVMIVQANSRNPICVPTRLSLVTPALC